MAAALSAALQSPVGDDGGGIRQLDAMADSSFVEPMRRAGWECGDGFISHGLPDGGTLWLYHDTVVGGRMVRNAAGIAATDPHGDATHTMFAGTDARGFIRQRGAAGERWYWPGVPLPQVQDRYVHIPATRMLLAPDEAAPFNFHREGGRTITYRYRNGELRRVGTSRLPHVVGWDGYPLSWGMAVAAGGGYVYIYATGASPDPEVWGHAVYAARLQTRRLDARRVRGFELLTRQGWRGGTGNSVSDLVQLGDGFSTVFAARWRRGRVLAAVKTHEILGSTIDLYRAEAPALPFHKVRTLVRLPLRESVLTYWAKAHPTLPAPKGKVWGSSNNNPLDGQAGCPDEPERARPTWYLLPGRLG